MMDPAADARPWQHAGRRYWRDVIDAWNTGGQRSNGSAAARLAVEMGIWTDPRQRPAHYVPGLLAQPLHAPETAPSARAMSESADEICREITELIGQLDVASDQARELTQGNGFGLQLCIGGRWSSLAAPRTRAAMGPGRLAGDVDVLVIPAVGSGTIPRCGSSNALLTLVLPVRAPADAMLRLAGRDVPLNAGTCVLADLSFEHEISAGAALDGPVVVLLVDLPHPGLTSHEETTIFGPATRLREALSDAGLERVELRPDGVFLRPGPELAELAGTYLRAAGLDRVVLSEDPPTGRSPQMMRSDGSTPGQTLTAARTAYSALIDSLHAGGMTEEARRAAELAVTQHVWDLPMQRDRDHVPGLAAAPFHDPAAFWFVSRIEQRADRIRSEILAVLDTPGDPVGQTLEDGWLLDGGSWRQAYLFRDGKWNSSVTAHFPFTTALLAEIPELTTFSPGAILISRLAPGTHITPHCGSTNAVLRIHLGITVPVGASIRVADEVAHWVEGRCLIFDDSYEHEVRHDGSQDRVVLIMDMAHPDLDPAAIPNLLAHRPTPRSRIVAFMLEQDLASITVDHAGLLCTPNEALSAALAEQLAALGARSARLGPEGITTFP